MNSHPSRTGRRRGLRLAVAVVVPLLAACAAEAGAGRTRPGGGRGVGHPSPRTASGHATYGHHSVRGHHLGYGHHYPYYYGYYAWPWGGWYGGWPYYVVHEPRVVNPDDPGAVETDVRPKRAEVFVDGSFVGQARDYNGRWELLWLEPGDHIFEFRRDGYRTLRRHIEVRAGMQVRIAERLQKGEGLDPRSSSAPPAAEPAAAESARPAPAGDRELGREAPGSLERGLLRLVVQPPDAAVYLDGEFLARASELQRLHGALPVARGRHTVEVVRPGFESHAVEVEVAGESPVRLDIDLEPRD